MTDAPSNSDPLYDLSTLDLFDPEGPSGKPAAQPDGEKFVVFFLGRDLYAVSARQVAEVVRPLACTPLPDAPAWLHGVANHRGEIVSVVDVSRIFRKKPAAVAPKSKFIVLKAKGAAAPLAFPVDRLSELVTLTPGEIEPAEDFRLFGIALYDKSRINLLDPDQLFASLV